MAQYGSALTIVYAGRNRVDASCRPHSHQLFQLIIPNDDTLEYSDHTGIYYPEGKREILLVAPSVRHTLRKRPDRGTDPTLYGGCAIDCKFSVLDAVLGEKLTRLPSVMDVGDISFYRELSSIIIRALSPEDSSDMPVALSALNTLLYALIYQDSREITSLSYNHDYDLNANRRGVDRAKQYIDENYQKPIKLEELIRLSALNRTTLCALFQQRYGYTPVEYQIHRRICAAKPFLMETSIKICDLSSKLGFSSTSYFCRVFRKHTGMSPVDFRNHAWSNRHIEATSSPLTE